LKAGTPTRAPVLALAGRFIALAGLLFALPAIASVVVAMTFEELTRSSPLVLRARIGQVQARFDDAQRSIDTYVEVQVTDVIKGPSKAGATLMVRTEGGVVGNIAAKVAGAARFTPGEDCLLFLEPARDTANVWLVNAMSAGKVTFTRNAGGELRAIRDTRGLSFYEKTGKTPALRNLEQPEDLGTPDEFIARIRRAVTR